MDMQNWKRLIRFDMIRYNESWNDIEYCTLSDEELNQEFDSGFGGIHGKPFTLWTKTRVYFPTCYDGLERVKSVSRFPDTVPTKHVGGG